MSRIRQFVSAAAGVALVALAAQSAQAQILSNGPMAVSLQGVKVERLSLALSTNALAATDLANNNVLGSLNATMSWSLNPSRGNVYLVGWFNSTAALSDGLATPNTIASSDVLAACTATNLTGSTCSATPVAFDQAADAAVGSTDGASRVLWSSPAITGTTRNQSGIYAGLTFQIRSTAVAALPAGTYNGTLNLRAYAQ